MNVTRLLQNNRAWVNETLASDAEYFRRRAAVHAPQFLWIGCSDARVPANVVTGLDSGDMFVHRNIANQVMPADANIQAVLQYAIDALGVQDVIVAGHIGCGGVNAALAGHAPLPHVQGWLANLRMIARLYQGELEAIENQEERARRLVELNVIEQIRNLAKSPVVEAAWAAGRDLRLHGWVYDVHTGLLQDLGVGFDGVMNEPVAPSRPAAQLATAAA